jgi:hypothetical protein
MIHNPGMDNLASETTVSLGKKTVLFNVMIGRQDL